MTNQEAIRTIDTMWKMLTSAYDEIADSFVLAYSMAIEALKAQDVAETNVGNIGDTIYRQAAIDVVTKHYRAFDNDLLELIVYEMKRLPSAQPEITDGQAVEHLQASGWMQNHDKQMYEMGLRERLADDSDSYDALLPSAQPERKWIPCSQELPPVGTDVILTFRDTFHTHPDWPKLRVKPAWRCNVEDVTPDGEWAIEGRLGNFVVKIEDGIAWMPLPEPWKGETS